MRSMPEKQVVIVRLLGHDVMEVLLITSCLVLLQKLVPRVTLRRIGGGGGRGEASE